MQILLLYNDAPGYFRVFNSLAERLLRDGHKVRLAVDSHYSFDRCGLARLSVPFDIFSAFFQASDDSPQVPDSWYQRHNINLCLLPDFERAQHFGIGGRRTREYYSRLKAALIQFFEHLILEHKIQAVIYENVSNTFAYLCWLVCQRHGVVYCGLSASRLPGRFAITDGPFTEYERCAELFHEVKNGRCPIPSDAAEYAKRYINDFDRAEPDYMAFNKLDQTGLRERYWRREKIGKVWSLMKHCMRDSTFDFQGGNRAHLSLRMVMRSVGRRARLGRVRRLYETPPKGQRYVLYPLQFHPEASTSVLSPFHIDELEVVRNIAFSLPEGICLFVKDHVSAYAYPSLAFYKKLKRLPNVVLVSPFEPTKKLIRNSLGVITLTSTVGYEALVLQKRVFLFGNVFYQFHPDVVQVRSFEELHRLFIKHLYEPASSTPADVLVFVASYYMATFPGTLNFTLGEAASESLARDIYPHIIEYITKMPRQPHVYAAPQHTEMPQH